MVCRIYLHGAVSRSFLNSSFHMLRDGFDGVGVLIGGDSLVLLDGD
jgi:hypothetical protein